MPHPRPPAWLCHEIGPPLIAPRRRSRPARRPHGRGQRSGAPPWTRAGRWALAAAALAVLVDQAWAQGGSGGFAAQSLPPGAAPWPWWALALALFALTSFTSVLAILAGVGGGVLYVPMVASLMPFIHIDFVRGAGIMVALTGALSAGPSLIRGGMGDLRLVAPIAVVASFFSILGASVGLALPTRVVQGVLGAVIIAIAGLLYAVRPSEEPYPGPRDRIAVALGIGGRYYDPALNLERSWSPRRMVPGLLLFAVSGFMAGMFGLGAAWANVPVLNLVMGLPLKLAVASSYVLLAVAGPAAALVYLTRGAMVPLVVVPTVLGSMTGARIGAWLLVRMHARSIRLLILIVLSLAGLRSLLRGFGI